MIGVPNDPMNRLKITRERAAPLELDAAELLERERREWSRHA
jgi:antitoxin PrlF